MPSTLAPQVLQQRYALYMRTSSEDQAERGTIEAQRDFLCHYTSLFQPRWPMNTPMTVSPGRCP
jgi:hypothetical protein